MEEMDGISGSTLRGMKKKCCSPRLFSQLSIHAWCTRHGEAGRHTGQTDTDAR